MPLFVLHCLDKPNSLDLRMATRQAHLAYAARGSLCANVSGEDKLWDIAAGLLIATEAGCRAEWLQGGDVILAAWLDGRKPDDALMLVAPPRILAELRATFLSSG